MAKEEFRIRIRRDGTILFRSGVLDAERRRRLREMLEEALGPAETLSDEDPDAGGAAVPLRPDKKHDEELRGRNS